MKIPRTRLDAYQRNEEIALRLAELFECSPYDESESFAIACEHILRIADDNHMRTGGKRRTWAKRTSADKPRAEAQRIKDVGAVLGAMLTFERRRTSIWVMDILEDALTYWPWQAKRNLKDAS